MSRSNTTEAALEACIERFLTGGVSDSSDLANRVDGPVPDYGGKGYLRGRSTDYNTEFAIDEAKFWEFLEATQADELAKLHYKPDWKRQVLERLHRKLKKGRR